MAVTLAMIVRNEGATIDRCLASARPHIDQWVICDTGSTDDTMTRVRAALSGIPGWLHEIPFSDFASTRNQLLELASHHVDHGYYLLLDADMEVVATSGALEGLVDPWYEVRMLGDPSYWMPYVVSCDVPWRYVGATHECLVGPVDGTPTRLDSLALRHHGDGGSRGDKFERDLRLLRAELETDPDNSRATFYLAQTLRDHGHPGEAVDTYLRRADMEGWDEEQFCALLAAGRLLLVDDWEAALVPLLRAHEVLPHRAEPLFELARGARHRSQHQVAYLFSGKGVTLPEPNDRLFVDLWVYQWGMAFEHSIAAWWAGHPDEALTYCDLLLAREDLPAEYQRAVEQNRDHCLRSLADSPEGPARQPPRGGE